MRVISGKRRGAKLISPNDEMQVRPTTDRVKESVFNLIQFDLGDSFLDLFAGTGQMGIEAISRGVEKVCFCEHDAYTAELVKANLKKTGFTDSAEVTVGDSIAFLKKTDKKFKTVFVDPPYEKGLSQRALEMLGRDDSCVRDDGLVVVESKNGEEFPEQQGKLHLVTKRNYSGVTVSVYNVSGSGKEQ